MGLILTHLLIWQRTITKEKTAEKAQISATGKIAVSHNMSRELIDLPSRRKQMEKNAQTHYVNHSSLGMGLGLRAEPYSYILEHEPKVEWFEILTENYLVDG
ncbi:Uncharacterised protein [Legionella oakridgensis]|nr:Uncharacterised protein [Legionella oakridgensis]